MREYIFDEKAQIEKVILNNLVDSSHPVKTIRQLVRYDVCVHDKNKDDIYNDVVQYMKKNYPPFTEIEYFYAITGCIKTANKGVWKHVDSIHITNSELQTISALNDIRKEKIAFVLLADAKYNNAIYDNTSNTSYLQMNDLFKLSRVTIKSSKRNQLLSFLYDEHLVERNINPKYDGKKLLFCSQQNDDTALTLGEEEYLELAYVYLNWKNGGYKKCKRCGRLFKSKTNKKYCTVCKSIIDNKNTKEITCCDCGEKFEVNIKDHNTTRCPKCYDAFRREYKRLKQQEYRLSTSMWTAQTTI